MCLGHEEPNDNTCLRYKQLKDLKGVPNRNKLLNFLPKNGNVLEVGVHYGNYSEKILDINNPKKLYLLDHWENEDSYFTYEGNRRNIVKDKFENYPNVELKKGYFIDIINSFPDNYFDWVYLDTIHTYEQVNKELEQCRYKIKQSGFIAGHDYAKEGILEKYKYGVREAIHEFCLKYDYKLKYLTFETDINPSFAITKIDS